MHCSDMWASLILEHWEWSCSHII